MTSSPLRAFVAAACLGAVSTVGDWIWARWIPDGAVVPGIVHGLLFFVALAVVLGWAGGVQVQGSTRSLLATLPVAGLALAALFYPVAAAIGYLGGLLVTWAGMWLTLAWLLRRALHDRESGVRTLGRAAIAMIGSGLAFWAVSGMWTRPAAETGYGLRFVYWTIAFVPGLLALLAGRDQPRA